jgi:hypothetical protein
MGGRMRGMMIAGLLFAVSIFFWYMTQTSNQLTEPQILLRQTSMDDLDILQTRWTYYDGNGSCDMQINLSNNLKPNSNPDTKYYQKSVWYYVQEPTSNYPLSDSNLPAVNRSKYLYYQKQWVDYKWVDYNTTQWVNYNMVPESSDVLQVCFFRGHEWLDANLLPFKEIEVYKQCKSFTIPKPCKPENIGKPVMKYENYTIPKALSNQP